MTTLEILDRLQGDALKDGELRKKTFGNPFGKGSSHCFLQIMQGTWL